MQVRKNVRSRWHGKISEADEKTGKRMCFTDIYPKIQGYKVTAVNVFGLIGEPGRNLLIQGNQEVEYASVL